MTRYRSPYITCHGPSMYPALRDGDGLILRECAGPADLRLGDIIVYPHPEEPYDVAHRIVRFSPAGVTTRGDNNDRTDPDMVPWPQILGRVISVRRRSKSFRPASGPWGTAIHRIGLARMRAGRAIAPLLRFASDLIARTGAFRFLRFLIPTDIVGIGREGAENYILRRKNKAIGRKSAATGGTWVIRFPYRLVFDRKKLP